MTLITRFLAKIDKSDECWTWTGTVGTGGYGTIGTPLDKNIYAHRYSYFLHFGELPEMVCHACDNRLCVRPTHLFAGNAASNMADRDTKNRQARGERHGRSRLTDAQVLEIRQLAADKVPQKQIAEKYGISIQYVSDLKHLRKRT